MTSHRSRFASLIAVAAIAMSAAATAFERVAERFRDGVFTVAASVFRFALRVAFGAPAPVAGDKSDGTASRRLTAASAFVNRILKRERPRIEARWAMCPSV